MKDRGQLKVNADRQLILSVIVLLVIILSYLYYLALNQGWMVALRYLVGWLLKPHAAGTFQSLNITYEGVLLTLAIFILGLSIGLSLFFNKQNRSVESSLIQLFCVSILTGYGFTGVTTMILAILGQLRADLMTFWLIASICVVNILTYRIKRVTVVHLISSRTLFFTRIAHAFRRKQDHKKLKIVVLIGVGTLFFFVFFHALLFPLIEWDAIVYHAEVARLWYMYRPSPPLIAGPSVGIQMSANYPSLFPAIGAFYYVILNQFNDVYLRLVSPIVAVVLALLVYDLGREISNHKSGLIGIVMLTTCPLFLMYSIWATSYILLATFIAASLYFFIKGTKHNDKKYLFIASLLLGFALSTSYLGILLLGFYVLVIIAKIFRKQFTVRETLLYSIPPLAIGSVQYIRNAVLLGNPLYPEGHSFLGGLFLDNRIIEASLREISNNALGYWLPWGSSLELFLKQVHAILFDKSLIPISSLLVIPGILLAAKKRDQQSLILGGWWFFVVAVQLLQGWFWIRTLLIILPSAVLLIVWTIVSVYSGMSKGNPTKDPTTDGVEPQRKSVISWQRPKTFAMTLAIVLGLALVFPALTLAFVGPNTPTWPNQLGPNYEYDRAWSNIGNVNETLFNAFDGDYFAWEWLNSNLGKSEKVATFDCRTYFIDDPSKIFYLDGIEAVPLYEISNVTALLDFFGEAKVKYLWFPGWVTSGPSKHPLYDQLPLTRQLGSEYFPEIRIFPPSFNSIMYEVRPQGGNLTVLSAWYGVAQESNRTIIPANQSNTRLYISTPLLNVTRQYKVSIHYLDTGNEPVNINFWNITSDEWTIPFSSIVRNNSDSWLTHTFNFSDTFGGESRFTVFGIYPFDVDLQVDNVQVTLVQ